MIESRRSGRCVARAPGRRRRSPEQRVAGEHRRRRPREPPEPPSGPLAPCSLTRNESMPAVWPGGVQRPHLELAEAQRLAGLDLAQRRPPRRRWPRAARARRGLISTSRPGQRSRSLRDLADVVVVVVGEQHVRRRQAEPLGRLDQRLDRPAGVDEEGRARRRRRRPGRCWRGTAGGSSSRRSSLHEPQRMLAGVSTSRAASAPQVALVADVPAPLQHRHRLGAPRRPARAPARASARCSPARPRGRCRPCDRGPRPLATAEEKNTWQPSRLDRSRSSVNSYGAPARSA